MGFKLNKVLITEAVDQAAVEILREKNLQVDVRVGLPKDQLLAIIGEYDALIVRSATKVTKDVIDAGKNLKLIGRAGVGVDNIDCQAATKAGVVVINAPGGNTISAVELTCTMILATARHVAQACAALKNGVWDRKSYMGNELKGKTLAVIGLGRIGREVATRMQSFEMRTIGFDPIVSKEAAKEFGVESLSLEEIYPQADFITVHTPLIPQTKHLLNEETLSKCKKGVRIINVARGGIVDENALLSALQSGQVAGAGLDVYVEEPPKNTQLIGHPKVVCTPHLGASTKEAQNNVAKEIALQFLDIMAGKSVPGVVNAPLLSEVLKHENLLWTMLGKALGKLAASHESSATEFNVTISGRNASAVAKLIKESVLVGVLNVRTKSDSVNVISASGIAESLAITANYTVENVHKCCKSSVTVSTNTGTKYTGIPQGFRPYLAKFNEDQFEPPLALCGHLAFFQTSKPLDVLGEILLNSNSILSTTLTANQLYAVHSSEKLILSERLQSMLVTQLHF